MARNLFGNVSDGTVGERKALLVGDYTKLHSTTPPMFEQDGEIYLRIDHQVESKSLIDGTKIFPTATVGAGNKGFSNVATFITNDYITDVDNDLLVTISNGNEIHTSTGSVDNKIFAGVVARRNNLNKGSLKKINDVYFVSDYENVLYSLDAVDWQVAFTVDTAQGIMPTIQYVNGFYYVITDKGGVYRGTDYQSLTLLVPRKDDAIDTAPMYVHVMDDGSIFGFNTRVLKPASDNSGWEVITNLAQDWFDGYDNRIVSKPQVIVYPTFTIFRVHSGYAIKTTDYQSFTVIGEAGANAKHWGTIYKVRDDYSLIHQNNLILMTEDFETFEELFRFSTTSSYLDFRPVWWSPDGDLLYIGSGIMISKTHHAKGNFSYSPVNGSEPGEDTFFIPPNKTYMGVDGGEFGGYITVRDNGNGYHTAQYGSHLVYKPDDSIESNYPSGRDHQWFQRIK